MANIDFFDDVENFGSNIKKNLKKLLKSKWFKIAVVIVIVLAIYVLYKKSKTQEVVYDSVPYGVTGYPEINYPNHDNNLNESTSDTSYLESILNDYLNASDEVFNEMNDNIETLHNTVASQQSILENQQAKMFYDSTIQRMKDNSNLYNLTTDQDLRDQLHAENQSLAKQIGLIYDPDSGNWYNENSEPAYLTTMQEAGTNLALSTGSKYQQEIIQQMQSNSKKWQSANASERKLLEQQNQSLGAIANLTYDRDSGKWYKDMNMTLPAWDYSTYKNTVTTGKGYKKIIHGSGSNKTTTITTNTGNKFVISGEADIKINGKDI